MIALRIALRELRGGIGGFRVFLLCLILGVAAIAAVGTLREGIRRGLDDQGAVLLGGDAQMEFTYRYASPEERAWMDDRATGLSEIVDFRSMAVVGEDRALTQVKGVDAAYPLVGEVVLEPALPLAEALAGNGAVMDGVLADRLGLAVGDSFRLGQAEFRMAARLVREPDSAAGGFALGPRTIVASEALAGSGLLEPGTLFETEYRMTLPADVGLSAMRAEAEAAFRDSGMSWQDRRRAAPGVDRFVERIGSFLVLVGLAGLAVGGVGISAAVRAYLDRKTEAIAVLKALGATGGTILAAYMLQIGALTVLGVVLGLLLGGSLPVLAAPLITAQMPIPVELGFAPGALAEAALYGTLTAAIFTLWPLARLREVRAAALFRDLGPGRRAWPGLGMAAAMALLVAALVGAAVGFSGVPELALGTLGGVIAALAVLALAAWGLGRLARQLAGLALMRGRPGLRLALSAIGGPRAEAAPVILSLGLGLAVLAAVGQIDANLRAAIDRDLPEVAPSYFFVDIQNDQIDGFRERLDSDAAVSRVDSAPMLRGIITQINGLDARTVAGSHWVLNGDRGVTYSDRPPANTTITAGEWWPEGYDGPPQASFSAEEAAEIGLKLGDRITVNILGRDLEAEVTSFRVVDFSTAGIGFVIALNPGALAGAPHTHIATVYAEEAAEAAILRDLATAYPNITAIRVRDAIDRVAEALTAIARATAIAAAGTLVTGFVVLIGAAAAGERARVYEAALLKVLGASRGRILGSFALRSAIMGAAAGVVAVAFGGVAGWAVMTFVMEAEFRFEPMSAIAIVTGGAMATLLAGLFFALRPLAARPAQVLRARD
ncbi:drug:proton antiporter [Frigidibacter albus]|uniref:Drug:proton antiporter n=1 Tax=Frigidibacter albus TaxID=1465486 RepID=A0A6L8VJJ5_9RHOB|nr:FtsX-like permease family protein [Frigidibacter albus]MZQ90515.1 drug:proton antiporter [Frigidibacter albus]NBE32365.1 drug:proton antiporter [Frigidibacter albus]GGH59378.1 drug:proton antiporter [Frigidibacter albus]